MKTVWDELDHLSPMPVCECGGCSYGLTKQFLALQQTQRMMHFLMKVTDGFQKARTNILMLDQPPTISQAYRLLLQEQWHKELTTLNTPSPDSLAFVSDRKTSFNRSSNSAAKPSVSGHKRPSRYFCEYCKISGHSVDRCFKIHGYPNAPKPGKKIAAIVHNSPDSDLPPLENTGLTPTQFNTLLSLLTKHASSDSAPSTTTSPPILNTPHIAGISYFLSTHNSSQWIIDSGATDHMCHSLSSFISLRRIHGSAHHITLPDGRRICVDRIGDVHLFDGIILRDVLYVPHFKFNLISVQRFCVDNNVDLFFTHSQCLEEYPESNVS